MSDTKPDFRTPGQHDSDRILYSAAYRRLAGVTQVVAVGERQLFHNRLTHSQKVAQLSRRIAQRLNFDTGNADGRDSLGREVDADVAEAAGLAHDMGHPPFGHVAEAALDPLCRAAGTDGYEGNAQTLRIVDKLAWRRTGRGLDLSALTLNGILKYPWLSDHSNAASKKWGAYKTEETAFKRARDGDHSTEQGIEAAVMDWADDISYAVHDMEDFLRAGFIRLDRLKNNPAERAEFVALANEELANKADWDASSAESTFDELIELVPVPLDAIGTNSHRMAVSRLGSFFIGRYVDSAKLDESGKLVIPLDFRREVMLLKQLTWQNVIEDATLTTMQKGHVHIISYLYKTLLEWLTEEKKRQRLPTRLREMELVSTEEEHPSNEARLGRVVADYVSQLTEEQALDFYARLTGSTRGTIHDQWVSF
ncbi:deoxyguanosinetriphosphate triphosphohydrolase family protein [Clavibacter michiganensis]|uniref:deoxyguanosinetriphosphate triphosphohydrolase family protein n=1 Tax=Clavibacter michiganensis TaxID=28447 RepID=UPI00293132E9|nr:dNTP triphosphohydrolase [Clavibacter michiganensis]